jgi:hypothetical protein
MRRMIAATAQGAIDRVTPIRRTRSEGCASAANGQLAAPPRSVYYNFVRIHQTIKVSPAMAAGVTDRLWEMKDLVEFVEAFEASRKRSALAAYCLGSFSRTLAGLLRRK